MTVAALALTASLATFTFGTTVGNHKPLVEERVVARAHAVDAHGAFVVVVHVGAVQSVTVTGDANIVPLVDTHVQNGRLLIGTTRDIEPGVPLVIEVTLPAVDALDASGAVEMNASGVHGRRVHLGAHGASTLRVAGQLVEGDVVVTGTSRAQLEALQMGRAHVSLSGSSSADLLATVEVDAHTAGASSLHVVGHPTVVKRDVSGASTMVID
jgi:hypothetical protein